VIDAPQFEAFELGDMVGGLLGGAVGLLIGEGTNHMLSQIFSYLSVSPALGGVNIGEGGYQPGQITQGEVDQMAKLSASAYESMTPTELANYYDSVLGGGSGGGTASPPANGTSYETFTDPGSGTSDTLTGSEGDIIIVSEGAESSGGTPGSVTETDNAGDQFTGTYSADGTYIASDTWSNAQGMQGSDTYTADGSSSGKVVYASGGYATYFADGLGNVTWDYYNSQGDLFSWSWVHSDGSSESGTQISNGLTLIPGSSSSFDVPTSYFEADQNPDGSYVDYTGTTGNQETTAQFNVSGSLTSTSTMQGAGENYKTAYGSLSLQWNLWNDGQDVAAYHRAQAGVRAATYGVDEQLNKTLLGVLQAYADLYASEITVRDDAEAAAALEAIQARSEKRYARGYGTEVAVGQARVDALNAVQKLNEGCRDLADKSAALAEAVGLELVPLQELGVVGALPQPLLELLGRADGEDLVESSPAVAQAREEVAAAENELHKAIGEFGPSVSLSVRRDYLGQNTDSFGRANAHIAPADYLIALEFAQPLFPLGSQSADVDKARSELRKAQASYRQARLEVQTKLAQALSARREAEKSSLAAEKSLTDAEQVLALTEAQYAAGRKDLDSVDHARMDREAAEVEFEKLASARAFAQWQALSELFPRQFSIAMMRQLHLEVRLPTGGSQR
jgi:outer membrane protein TolC